LLKNNLIYCSCRKKGKNVCLHCFIKVIALTPPQNWPITYSNTAKSKSEHLLKRKPISGHVTLLGNNIYYSLLNITLDANCFLPCGILFKNNNNECKNLNCEISYEQTDCIQNFNFALNHMHILTFKCIII